DEPAFRGAHSGNSPDQASERSSGVLVISECQLPAPSTRSTSASRDFCSRDTQHAVGLCPNSAGTLRGVCVFDATARAYGGYDKARRKECKLKVAIVGGGIGGMTLALSLLSAGIDDVDIFESAPTIKELGVGINVLPHGVRELAELDLLGKLYEVGIPTADFAYYSRHGQRIWHEPLGLAAGYLWP